MTQRKSAEKEPSPQEIDMLVTLFNKKRYAEMETLAREMAARFPGHGIGWKAMGTALVQQGRNEEALVPLRKAAEFSQGDFQPYNNLGNALLKLGRLHEAEAVYRQALELNPGFAIAHYNLGNTLQKLGRLPEAKDSLHRALEINPGFAEAHNNLGIVLQGLGQLDDAVASHRRALEIKPDYAEAHNSLGLTLYKLGRLDEAEASYRRAFQAKPDYAEARYNIGNVFKEQGRLEEAAACYKSCLEIEPEDRLGARLLLASLGFEPMPPRASEAHLEAFYISKASTWDMELGRTQKYYGAKLVAQALKSQPNKPGKLDILDAGCGTGHVGLLVRDMASRLDGVDMSPDMLEKAKEKKVYDNIYQADLESFMQANPGKYDAVTCAATLIHFGDLSPAFMAAAACLRNNGLFVFTVFPNEREQDGKEVVVAQSEGLARSGCYAHGKNYITRLAESAGFVVEAFDTEIHEYHKDKPVMCFVVVLRQLFRLAGLREPL